jgi:tight adherence protein B
MIALVIGVSLGFGILLIFDGLTRPRLSCWPRSLKQHGPSIIASAGGTAVALVATGWPAAALAGAALGMAVPRLVDRNRSARLRQARREALAGVASRLRDAVRGGLGIMEGLVLVSATAPEALKTELRDLTVEARTGSLNAALERFAQRLDEPIATLFAQALTLADRLGSSGVSDVLDSLAEAASAQAATAREVRARQTHQRVSARVVAVVPLVLLFAIKLANPQYLAPYESPMGQLVLLFGFGLIAVGYRTMVMLSRLPEAKGGGRR